MSFKSGTVIEVLEKNDDWWHGRCQGTSITGWFPLNRAVPPKTSSTTSPTSGPIKTTKKAPAPPGAGGAGAVKASRPAPVPTTPTSTASPVTSAPPPPPKLSAPPQGEAMKAVYDFEGQQTSDLR